MMVGSAQPIGDATLDALTVLDIDFAPGINFSAALARWRANNRRPRMLHYVGLLDGPQMAGPLRELLCTDGSPLLQGIQRVLLESGQVSVTLCVGDTHAMLAALRMQADAVVGLNPGPSWNRWTWKLLAKLCRLGASVELTHISPRFDTQVLMDAGFVPAASDSMWAFQPRWTLRRHASARSTGRIGAGAHCVVIGGGLAGASVAHALARRGWRVTVLDRHDNPAGGASGLPAGLAVPQLSVDDSPRSRLTSFGVALLHQHARALLVQDQDWAPSGVLECRRDGIDQWHPLGCWVRPARLVAAWLAHPDIRYCGGHRIQRLNLRDGQWQVWNAAGDLVTQAQHVVLANAFGARDIAFCATQPNPFAALQAVRGVVSGGQWPHESSVVAALPPYPVNGNGSFIPFVPGPDAPYWYCGATYEVDEDPAGDVARGHQANRQRLLGLLPQLEPLLPVLWQSHGLHAWSGERCATRDRLPLVGRIDEGEQDGSSSTSGLWCSIGLGSRGLSLAALCAELLVADMGAEPMPMEPRLFKCLRAARHQSARPA